MSKRGLYARVIQSCEIGETVREIDTGYLWELTLIKDNGDCVLARTDGYLPVRVVRMTDFFEKYDGYRGWYNDKQDEPMLETFKSIINDNEKEELCHQLTRKSRK